MLEQLVVYFALSPSLSQQILQTAYCTKMPSTSFQKFDSLTDVIYLFCALGCVVCAALAAGMTMGLLSLDSLKLRIKLRTGTPLEIKAAKRILPLIEDHHFLLCTLLLFNAAANEALPIFLDAIVPAWAAVIIAVTLVLICGEILPTALFTGPNQLQIASRFTSLVYFLQFIFYPVAFPMAKALDYFLGEGEDDDNLNREEISAMMKILQEGRLQSPVVNSTTEEVQQQQSSTRPSFMAYIAGGGASRSNKSFVASSHGNASTSMPALSTAYSQNSGHHHPAFSGGEEEPLSVSEVQVITGVLGLAKKSIRDIYVPLTEVNMVSADQILDSKTMEVIEKVGNSRLPVFKGTDIYHILGFLRVKKLLRVPSDRNVAIGSLPLIKPFAVGCDQSLLDVLRLFQLGHSHLALVSEEPGLLQDAIDNGYRPSPHAAAMGIVSIEDIFEEMLQGEIFDEEDVARSPADFLSASLHLREMSMRASMSPLDLQLDPRKLAEREAQRKLREKALLTTHGHTGSINPLIQESAAVEADESNVPTFNPVQVNTILNRPSGLKEALIDRRMTEPVPRGAREDSKDDDNSDAMSMRSSENEGLRFTRVFSSEDSRRQARDERRRIMSTNSMQSKNQFADLQRFAAKSGLTKDNNGSSNNLTKLTPSMVTKYISRRARADSNKHDSSSHSATDLMDKYARKR